MRRWVLIAVLMFGCRDAIAADLLPYPAAPQVPIPAVTEPARVAPDRARITLIEENDVFVSTKDRWYTQGFALSYLSTPLIGGTFDWLFPGTYTNPGATRTQKFELLFGQNIFTPEDLGRNPPDPRDRPYAGWLYTGAGLYQETNRNSLDHFEVLVGVVGPAALAQQAQDFVHTLAGRGGLGMWGYQLSNEPGIVLSYDHKWRFEMPVGAGFSVDVIPEFGGTVGNVYTYGEAGMMVRLGQNLKADYGPARIRPGLSGTTWFNAANLSGPTGWYLFAGVQARAVARNIFLDGNTFTSSASIDKRTFVGDFSAGVSAFWTDAAKVDLVATWRSAEFVGQTQPDFFGGINMSFALP